MLLLTALIEVVLSEYGIRVHVVQHIVSLQVIHLAYRSGALGYTKQGLCDRFIFVGSCLALKPQFNHEANLWVTIHTRSRV